MPGLGARLKQRSASACRCDGASALATGGQGRFAESWVCGVQMEQVLEAVLDRSQLRQEETVLWRLQLDVYVLDADGSLLDSCLLAAVAALLALRLPSVAQAEGDSVHPEQYLRMGALPLSTTFTMIGDHLLADPTAEEEAQAASLVSMTTDARGSLTGATSPHFIALHLAGMEA